MSETQGGSKEAFGVLVQRYTRPLYDYIFLYLRDHHRTEELLQDIFLSVYAKASSYTAQGRFKTWIYTIARNRSFNVLKRNKISPVSTDLVSEQPDKTTVPEYTEDVRRKISGIQQMMDALKPVDRDILAMRFFQEMSFQDISEVVGMAESHVRTRFVRSLDFLRHRFPDFRSFL